MMISGNTLAEVASLIGDPARANMLLALMDGRALSAGELVQAAGVSAQTTSGHLAKLAEAMLVVVERQGRHRCHRLATPEVAQALEALMAVAAAGPRRHRPSGQRDEALRPSRPFSGVDRPLRSRRAVHQEECRRGVEGGYPEVGSRASGAREPSRSRDRSAACWRRRGSRCRAASPAV